MAVANLVDASTSAGLVGLPDRYRLDERLAGGASGETYAATDTEGAPCVIKVFAPGAVASGAALAELRGLTSLAHPAIVRVREMGRLADGRPFLITDRVLGPSIASLASVPDDGARRAALEGAATDLAQALAHLHGRGLVHGDVSPANVRLTDLGSRAVLIDFGLAGPPAPGDGGARGTLGYAAPEALTGVRSPACDLFGLGATLFEAWTGAAPFGRGLPAVQRMLASPAPTLSSVRPGLEPEWDHLVARLLSADPDVRPRSAREVLRELARIRGGAATPLEVDLGVPHPEGDPLQAIVVGRRAERAALRAAIDRLADGAATSSTLCLVGAAGSGRRTVFEAVAREVAIAGAAGTMPPIEVWRGDFQALAALADPGASVGDEDESRAAERRFSRLAERLEAKGASRPLCLWLEEDSEALAFARIWAGAPPSGRVLLVLPVPSALGLPFSESIALAPFGEAEIGALLAGGTDLSIPSGAVVAIARAAQGNAAVAGVLARRLIAGLRAGASTFSIEPGADLDRLLEHGYRLLPPHARTIVLALALAEGREDELLGAAELSGDGPPDGLAAAGAAGWIERTSQGGPRLPSAAHRRAALAAADPVLRTRLAERALERLEPGDPRRPDALIAAGRQEDAATCLRGAAARVAAAGEPGRAALLLERAIGLDPRGEAGLELDERILLATGYAVFGRYDDALQVVRRAAEVAEGAAGREICDDREAWLLTRKGDLEGARAVLAGALAAGGGEGSPELRARLGRLLVAAGRFEDALKAVEPLVAAAPRSQGASSSRAEALGQETAILANAYLGRADAARAFLDAAEQRGAMAPGRRAYLQALVAQLDGAQQGLAGSSPASAPLVAYRRALELASAEGDVHTVGAVALNLAALLAGEGLYGEALSMSERAVRELGRIGGVAELGTAIVNAANLFVLVGDLSAARRALDRVRARTSAGQVALTLAPATFVEGDLARREGELSKAAGHYRDASRAFLASGQPHRAASALASAAEVLAMAGALEEARRAVADAEALWARARGGASEESGVAVELLRAQATIALADGSVRPPPEIVDRLAACAGTARRDRRRPEAWRLAALSGRLAERAGDPSAARAARTLAAEIFEEVRMATPEHHRPGLDADPEALWVRTGTLSGSSTLIEEGIAARAQAAEARLRRLLRINKRLNSELRLPRLLETILDTVIELTDAERGFILLEDEAGTLEVKVARNIDQRTLETAELELSRSIARQAATGGEPIVTIDAAGDARFKEALSVSDLHLRSVLAVPLSIKGRVAGTIYVDHRLRKGAFNQEDVRLVLDFAEQAAIALENARLLAELRRRERQVEALNRRLEVELAARREELSGIKQELRDNREALAVRYDYRNIIGRTPRMLDLFRLLDRITDTTLPVVIQGESGTGKELVARAIHSNGPRRDRPFVGENCAAIPETLLESTLFGYVRGAFTGADHDTRGLFEIADGGTLFLDEVGEMSPAMQGKLLRVLQEGELRRVGSERTRKVDVRIVTATNRDLARLVDEGKFRRDLFFRLNVATISLPPLRERRDDIPLIVEHFLNRLGVAAGRSPKPIDPQALARLVAYRWPGNVRELENEITRADALSGERIAAADLSPQVAAAGDPGAALAVDPDSLLLKPRVERLERSLLREALGRAGGNQTKAADLLGLSRFGLQKKLKRYNLGSL